MAKAKAKTSSKPKKKPGAKKNVSASEYAATGKELLQYYKDMLLIRRFEEKAGQLYGMGHIGGFCHLYIGQEAIAVGVQSALGAGDSIITGYRDHGHLLACGTDPKTVMAELTGRSNGVAGGKGGSMHMFDLDRHFYGGHGIVGTTVPLGAGLALAHKYRDDGGISVAYFGDGAANQGQVYETFNMAELWSLPILLVIENNQYAMGTSIKRSTSETHLYRRGAGFRIPGKEVDGMNVLEVRAAVDEAAATIRAGRGPILLEMITYRYRGHSMSDPAKYRSRDEVEKVREERDPINLVKEKITGSKATTSKAIKKIDLEVKAVIEAAAEFALESPEPEANVLFADVLKDTANEEAA